ncbi:MAG TPA: hypothetical protein VGJ25_01460 [Gaiellaceae bacterium]
MHVVADLMRYERWYGRNAPPVERQHVAAGPLVAELEAPDLRYVGAGELELVRRLYAAVRDRNWGTVAPTLSDVELIEADGGFAFRFDAHHVDVEQGVDLSSHGEIAGAFDGTLTCTLEGEANVAFDYNRIGWCILHPAELAGRPYRARAGGEWSTGVLPMLIGPQSIVDGLPAPLFPSFTELQIELGAGRSVRFELEGDQFEMEDQRNWTDASFKTYSTPLALGFPHRAEKGQRFRQVVRMTVTGAVAAPQRAQAQPTIVLGELLGRLPPVGLGASSLERPLSEREARHLSELLPTHLRVDLDVAGSGWRDTLAREAGTARAIGAALELAVFGGPDDGGLDELAAVIRSAAVPVARVLAFRHGEPTTSGAWVERVRAALAEASGGAPVFGGTNILFTELNRHRPELGAPAGIAWPLNATVHASDDTSVLETAAMHGETVRSACAFCGDLPLAVTPITFNQRFNPVATGPEPEPGPGELPSQVDPRQPSLLGAAWTLAGAKHLAEAGAASLTYFETVGWRGVVEADEGCPAPARFRSLPGTAFPLYHVLADLCELRDAEIVAARSSAPLALEALALRSGGRMALLVANLSPVRRSCRIADLPVGSVTVRRLDEQSFVQACTEPASFRAGSEALDAADRDSLTLELASFAYARVEVSP